MSRLTYLTKQRAKTKNGGRMCHNISNNGVNTFISLHQISERSSNVSLTLITRPKACPQRTNMKVGRRRYTVKLHTFQGDCNRASGKQGKLGVVVGKTHWTGFGSSKALPQKIAILYLSGPYAASEVLRRIGTCLIFIIPHLSSWRVEPQSMVSI